MRIVLRAAAVAAVCFFAGWIAWSFPAIGADLPNVNKAYPFSAPRTPATPAYVYIQAGIGVLDAQNDISLGSRSAVSPRTWLGGGLVGAGLGYLVTGGPIAYGGEIEANYDFTNSSLACLGIAFPCAASVRNSWFFAERLLVGITAAQMFGYVPGSASAANWPIPITVPASFWSNLVILGTVGAAERDVNLCVTGLVTLAQLCQGQWRTGLDVGGQVRLAVSSNSSIRITYDYLFDNQSFAPPQTRSPFTNAVWAKDQQRVMGGYVYNF